MLRKKILITVLLVAVFLNYTLQAEAQNGGHRRGGPRAEYYTPHYEPYGRVMRDLPDDYVRMILGGLEYFYWEGMFYRMSGNQYVVVSAPIGAIVTTIPQGSQPVIIDGVAYYNINGVTYMYTPYGYQVVPQPKTIVVKNYVIDQDASMVTTGTSAAKNTKTSAVSSNDESFTVNIPNSKGGYTAVTLKRSGGGFTGPQGEYYTEFPKIEQLKVMYGK